MKYSSPSARVRKEQAFTLVEMIGVLAIIAILASLLIPRVFQAIGDSKISNSASTCNSIKAAVNEYYGKYGLIAGPKGVALTLSGTPATAEDWDLTTLVAEGFAEKPFTVRIGNGKLGSTAGGSRLRVIDISGNTTNTAPADASTDLAKGAYNLDGASTTNDISGSLLVEAVIEQVDAQDAKDFNDRIDGANLGASSLTNADQAGRVKYTTPTAGKTSVRVYLAHR
ncbi:MAG: prepilin-type N-terminal cleavage/methylation domain-containing protein [Verrucomicrobiales bacterium]|nr:prepilin-type N-terminal cleavage/methylation domain-containing protein [Verrucomicrobiales bacterium]